MGCVLLRYLYSGFVYAVAIHMLPRAAAVVSDLCIADVMTSLTAVNYSMISLWMFYVIDVLDVVTNFVICFDFEACFF